MSFRTDDELMLDYGRRGDTAAFDELYQRYRKPLFGFIRQQVPELAANNVYSLCWKAVIQLASNYMPAASFRSYLYTIARRRVTEYWSSQAVQGERFEPDSFHHGQHQNAEALHQEALLVCVGQLSEMQRDAFLLKQTGLTQAEISLMLGSSFEALRSCLKEAYQNIKSCWECPLADERIDARYRAAISEFEVWVQIDSQVKQLAHQQVLRSYDWAALPAWNRVVSMLGIAVLVWWLWSHL